MKTNIFNTAGCQYVDKRAIRRLVRRTLREEGRDLATVTIVIADSRYMRYLNEKYLNRKRTTNVISFNLGEVSEIYVSDEMARDSYELNYYILHGLLHVLGYDHRDKHERMKMREKCTKYLRDD